MQIHTLTHSIPAMEALVSFAAGGVMERFPTLQVAFLEANCSWAPWLLWRLDEHYELGGFHEKPELKMKPSDYFRRQGYVSIEADESPARFIGEFGIDDNLIFSTDFPHPDSKWPNGVENFLQLPLSDSLRRKILCNTPARSRLSLTRVMAPSTNITACYPVSSGNGMWIRFICNWLKFQAAAFLQRTTIHLLM